MYKVIIIPESYADISTIYEYIAGKFLALNSAQKISDLIFDAIDSLTEFPERCHLITGLSYTAHQYRMLIVKNYMVVFYVDSKVVTVVAVMYKRRNFRNILNNELPRRDS